MKTRIKKIHFIGIGGTGMCGIAEVLHNLGYSITGSDLSINQSTRHLQAIGVTVFQGHDATNIKGTEVVVTSSAIKQDNPEVKVAIENNIPVIPRALMLSELMRFRSGIAIAGTHGKTTTTSMVASILDAAGLDPTYVIGGRLTSVASNAKLGKGQYIVAEADESDASFLYLTPLYTIITNIDEDHMETYDFNINKLYQAFIEFVHRMPFYGMSFLCIESEHVKNIIPSIKKPFSTYGLTSDADIFATDIKANGFQMHFVVNVRESDQLIRFPVMLNFPGIHSVLNALAAIGVSLECGASIEAIQQGLLQFQGVGRRFQLYGEIKLPENKGSALVVDDYGHHPIEMQATIEAARAAYPNKRIVLAFQPHRYTRTRDLFEDFVAVLKTVDLVVLTEVYSAGELPIIAADSKALARSLRIGSNIEPIYEAEVGNMAARLLAIATDNDLILIMGAGSINKVAEQLITLNAKNTGY